MQWCPTELDNEGKYVSGKWGYCMDYDADWLPDACDPVVQSGKNGSLIFPIFSSYVSLCLRDSNRDQMK